MAYISGLTRFATPALARLRAFLDQLGTESVNAHLRLPHLQPLDLFNPSRYVSESDSGGSFPSPNKRNLRKAFYVKCDEAAYWLTNKVTLDLEFTCRQSMKYVKNHTVAVKD